MMRSFIANLIWPILMPVIYAAACILVLFLPQAAQALIYGMFHRTPPQILRSALPHS